MHVQKITPRSVGIGCSGKYVYMHVCCIYKHAHTDARWCDSRLMPLSQEDTNTSQRMLLALGKTSRTRSSICASHVVCTKYETCMQKSQNLTVIAC
jgi:hypothetical protein